MPARHAMPSVLVLFRARCCELFHHIGNGEARRLGAWRKVLEAFNILRHDRLSRHELWRARNSRGPAAARSRLHWRFRLRAEIGTAGAQQQSFDLLN